jgi:hypothetical protein
MGNGLLPPDALAGTDAVEKLLEIEQLRPRPLQKIRP